MISSSIFRVTIILLLSYNAYASKSMIEHYIIKMMNQKIQCLTNKVTLISQTDTKTIAKSKKSIDTTIYILNTNYTYCKLQKQESYISNKLTFIIDDKNRAITYLNSAKNNSNNIIGYINLSDYVFKYENDLYMVFSKITHKNKSPLRSNMREIFIAKSDTLIRIQIDYNYDLGEEIVIQTIYEYTNVECDRNELSTQLVVQKNKHNTKYRDYKIRDWRAKYE